MDVDPLYMELAKGGLMAGALVVVWRAYQGLIERLFGLINDCTKSINTTATAVDSNTKVTLDLKTVIEKAYFDKRSL